MLLKKDPNVCVKCGAVLHMLLSNWCMAILASFQRTQINKIWGGFKVCSLLRLEITVEPWPVFIGEKCAACGGMANMRGSEAHMERQGTE